MDVERLEGVVGGDADRPMTAACCASTPDGTAVTAVADSPTYSVKLPLFGPRAMPGVTSATRSPTASLFDAVTDGGDGADEVTPSMTGKSMPGIMSHT